MSGTPGIFLFVKAALAQGLLPSACRGFAVFIKNVVFFHKIHLIILKC